VRPVFKVKFNEPVSLDAYLPKVMRIVRFFSFCLGAIARPSNIFLLRLVNSDENGSSASDTDNKDFEALYIWQEEGKEGRELRIWDSPLNARNVEDLNTLKECLIGWINRSDEWEMADSLMSGVLRNRNSISPERLLAVYKWFEALPNSSEKVIIPQEHIERIARAAIDAATSLELSHLSNGIKNKLSDLKKESVKSRLNRLVDVALSGCGLDLQKPIFLKNLERITDLRARAAHRSFKLPTGMDNLEFYKVVLCLESLCFLATAADLPLKSGNRLNLKECDLVRRFLVQTNSLVLTSL